VGGENVVYRYPNERSPVIFRGFTKNDLIIADQVHGSIAEIDSRGVVWLPLVNNR
jgi:hypothetical protein